MFHVDESKRIRTGQLGSDERFGCNGAFRIYYKGYTLNVFASDGSLDRGPRWEHVSVSIVGVKRTPTWEQMAYIKSCFWDEEDTVIQYHPARSEYVNCHEFVLHMWRPVDVELPKPHYSMVGPKPGETMAESIEAYNRDHGAILA